MTAVWPPTLPQCPILNGLGEQRQRHIMAFAPEVGPPKMKRRSTAVEVLTNLAFRMTNAQVLTFYTFYETTLSDGILPFDWPHPVTKISYTWVFEGKEAPKRDRMTPNTSRITFNLLRLP
jgi:hypothetical protein